jgi:toxin ParE1/3/4
MATIVKRPRARNDLIEIWAYIAEDSDSKADAFVELLDRKFRALAENPAIGRARHDLTEGLRSFPVGRYVIFYMPLGDGVEVIRVLHSARDIDAEFERKDE